MVNRRTNGGKDGSISVFLFGAIFKGTAVSVNAFVFDLVVTCPERMTLGRSLLL